MSTDILSNLTRHRRATTAMEREESGLSWDLGLLFTVFALVCLGLVMLYSASAVMAAQRMGDHQVLLNGQIQKTIIGVGALIFALQLDYRWYQRLVYPILGGTFLMMILVIIPGLGVEQNGAQRWLQIAGFSFQPAEFAKLTAAIFLAYSISKKGKRMGSFTIGFIPHLFIIGLMVGLMLLQPDFGTSVILMAVLMIMLFVSGAKLSYLFVFTALGAGGAYFAISAVEYRMKRIVAFLDPFSYRQDIGYQLSESLIAIGSGGLSGRGLGEGSGKLGYVPELWNDFIATIIAEELGIMGIIALLVLFTLLLWRGFRIAFRATDAFGLYLAVGITTTFALQAAMNLFVVTGMLPTKGLTLPFVSFGGSSMIVSLFAVGILLNISKNEPDRWEEKKADRLNRREAKRWQRRKQRILKRREDLRPY